MRGEATPRMAVQDFNAGYGGTLSRRPYEVTSHIWDPFEYRPEAVFAPSRLSGRPGHRP